MRSRPSHASRGVRGVAVAAIVAMLLAGCSAKAPLPSGAIAVPTDENLVPPAVSGTLCTAAGVIPPLTGTFRGAPTDPAWPVWLVSDDGRTVYLLWPRGFSVRFDPAATLLDENGVVVIHDGSRFTLEQQGPDPTQGTKERPYLAEGLWGTGFAHSTHCYTPRA